MIPEQQQRILELFIEEAKEHLTTLEQGLLNLQSTLEDTERLNEVFRAAHSVKGGAAMLGIHSIQQVAHRLEDYFKVLKESPVQVDQKIESQFLRVYDALQDLVEQLQGHFGIPENVAESIMSEIEPVFEDLNTQLLAIAPSAPGEASWRQSDRHPVPSVAVAGDRDGKMGAEFQEESALQLIFQSDVPARLREMLQLFKQPEQPETRRQLQEICRSLAQAGDQFELRKWGELIEAATAAIANPAHTYSAIAPIIIKEIKQAQELVLVGAGNKISIGNQLKALAPTSRTERAEGTSPSVLTANASKEKAAKTPVATHASPVRQPIGANWSTGNIEESGGGIFANTPSSPKRAESTGPEVGLAELNSLADLFEGDAPELDTTWETEEVMDSFERESGQDFTESSETDANIDFLPSDFSDLLFEEENASAGGRSESELDDLNSLFGGALLDDDLTEASDSGAASKEQKVTAATAQAKGSEEGTRNSQQASQPSLGWESSKQDDFKGFNEVDNLDDFFTNQDENDPTFADASKQALSLPSEDDLEAALFGEDDNPPPRGAGHSVEKAADGSEDEWDGLWGNLEATNEPELKNVELPRNSATQQKHSSSANVFDDLALDESLEFENLFDEAEEKNAKSSAPLKSERQLAKSSETDENDLSDLLSISNSPNETAESLNFGDDDVFLDGLLEETEESVKQENVSQNGKHSASEELFMSSDEGDESSENLLELDENSNVELDDLFGGTARETSVDKDETDKASLMDLEALFALDSNGEGGQEFAAVERQQPAGMPASSAASGREEETELDNFLDDLFDEGESEKQLNVSSSIASPEVSEAAAQELELLLGAAAVEQNQDLSGELDALFDSQPSEKTETPDLSSDWFEAEMDSNLELDFAAAAASEATLQLERSHSASEEDDSPELLDSLFDESEEDDGISPVDDKQAPALPQAVLTPQEAAEFAKLEAFLNETPEATLIALGMASKETTFSELENLLAPAKQAPVPAPVPPKPSPATIAPPKIQDNEFDELEKLLLGFEPMPDGKGAKTRQGPGPQSKPGQKVLEQNMRVPIKQLDNLSNLVGELVVNRNSLEQDQERLRQFLDNLLHQVTQLSDVGQRMQDLYERSLLEIALLTSRQARAAGNRDHASGASLDALEMDRFTGFHILSQEIIELIVRVRESASDIEFLVDEADQVTRQLRQVTTQLQEGLTRARMVSFAQTTDRLYRSVRDVAVKEGKQAELHVEGRETQIDKMIADQLFTPLNHLVNNAIAHGIEPPEDRMAAGKPPVGRLTIRAFHQGNQTAISFSDDGAGIDPERVKAKAIEKRLITAAQAKNMSRQEVYELLFEPNFSTKDEANDIAGRGVGLNAVLDKINEIRGVITTDSTMGKGTTFTIRLPLMLSISKALVCISDRARIAFPMDGVEDMLDVPRDRIQTTPDGKSCIPWRDSMLPFRHLRELLGYNRHLGRGSVYGSNVEEDVISVVVLRSAGNYLALQVDQVLGEQEIVIKQLEGPVPKPVGVAGATVMGDGRIVPIADVLELIDLAAGRLRRESGNALWDEGTSGIVQEAPPEKTEPTVLIVDDSITVRELLSMTFNKAGYRVEQARDGQEAWEKLRAGLPCDIVFCDIEMPRMDGLELLSRMQKDAQLTELPIAMLTSRGADRHRQMAVQLGARGYFTKPYLEEALLEAASRMLKGEVLVTAKAEA